MSLAPGVRSGESDAGESSPRRLLDPLIVAAATEVDRTLIRWMLGLSPRERLRASTKASRALSRYRRVSP